MRYLLILLYSLIFINPAFCQEILWQGKVKNTDVRIVAYTDFWNMEYKSFDEWRILDNPQLQLQVLKLVLKHDISRSSNKRSN